MDDTTNAAIEAARAKWKRKQHCHTAGILSFNDIERQLMDAMPESGEIFVRKVRQAFGNGRVPFALEVIEALGTGTPVITPGPPRGGQASSSSTAGSTSCMSPMTA